VRNGTIETLGSRSEQGMTGLVFDRLGWVLRLVEAGMEGRPCGVDVMEIDRPGNLVDLADLGLTQAEGKRLLARVLHGSVERLGVRPP
jgi:hypothetical protein